jgi:hypothetical protein
LLDAGLDLGADVDVLGAALSGEGHIDGDVLLTFGYVVEADFIDQAEIDDVDGDFGIVALLECVQNVMCLVWTGQRPVTTRT